MKCTCIIYLFKVYKDGFVVLREMYMDHLCINSQYGMFHDVYCNFICSPTKVQAIELHPGDYMASPASQRRPAERPQSSQ